MKFRGEGGVGEMTQNLRGKAAHVPEFDVVDRPIIQRSAISPLLLEALIVTSNNGKALRIPLNGEHSRIVRDRFAQALARKHYRIGSRSDGKYLVIWAMK